MQSWHIAHTPFTVFNLSLFQGYDKRSLRAGDTDGGLEGLGECQLKVEDGTWNQEMVHGYIMNGLISNN